MPTAVRPMNRASIMRRSRSDRAARARLTAARAPVLRLGYQRLQIREIVADEVEHLLWRAILSDGTFSDMSPRAKSNGRALVAKPKLSKRLTRGFLTEPWTTFVMTTAANCSRSRPARQCRPQGR